MFESMARPLLVAENVPVVHGKELHQTKPPFAGWSLHRKHDFVRSLQAKLETAALFGVTYAIKKENYIAAKKRDRNVNLSESAFGYCFRVVADTMLRAASVKQALEAGQKLSFVIEQGNKNNNDARRIYNEMVIGHKLGFSLGGLSFANKDSTISLQMADLLAYYLRRYGNACDRAGTYVEEPEMIKILKRGKIPVTGLVVTGFERGKPGRDMFLSDEGFRRAERGDSLLRRPLK
jgi:hypothetical protein